MRNGLCAWNRNAWLALLAAGLLSFGGACGDDSSSGEEDDTPEGEPCSSPGRSETGCMCSSSRPPGYRQCTEEGVWSACSCPPAMADNECRFPGQTIECWACPGESEGRITECLEDRTFDCSCRDGGAPRDGG